jgi:streptogramin lyase
VRAAIVLAIVCTATAAAAPLGATTEFPVPSAESNAYGIASGPDGNLWFAEQRSDKIARVTTAGAITEFAVPTAKGEPTGVAAGPDGSVWFTEFGAAKIGRITPAGVIAEYETPTVGSGPFRIALGPDGNLWFVEYKTSKIGRITPSGIIMEFELPAKSGPLDIAAGADGNLWFTEETNKIGRITPAGTISEFEIPTASSGPEGIAAGPDGNVWFTEYSKSQIGRINVAEVVPGTSKGITEFPIPTSESHPEWITAGPDGELWFTETTKNRIGRITPAGAVADFEVPTAASSPAGIATGPDGNLWVTEYSFAGNRLARVGAGVPEALVSSPAVSGGGQAGTAQTCNSVSWATWASLQPSVSLYGFDGYRWLLDGSQIATGQSYTPSAANVGHQLACAETVTYPLPFLVSAAATSPPVTVVAPIPLPRPLPRGCSCPRLVGFPQITAASESHRVWREGSRLARISKRKRPVGTVFSFTLNRPARVRFVFAQQAAGRKVNGRCVAQTQANRQRRPCRRGVTRGALSFAGRRGSNRVAFQGRLSRSSRLPPGAYTVTIVATIASGPRSSPVRLTFTIVK